MRFSRNYAGVGYNCAGCDQKSMACLRVNDSVTLRGPNLEAFTGKNRIEGVTKENARQILGDERFIGRCIDVSLCPIPFFEELPIYLLRLYNTLDGTRRMRTPDELNRLPAIYIEACDIIESENNRIDRFRESQKLQMGGGR